MAGNFPLLNFASLADYEPYEGGGHGFVGQEGLYCVKIDAAEPELSKDGSKGMVKVGAVLQDADSPFRGQRQIGHVIYSGTDKNGKSLVRQFADLLTSTGTPKENIQQYGKAGTTMQIEQAVGQLVGREAYVRIEFSMYNGQMTSGIAGWVTKDVYNKAKENNGHRGRKAEQVTPAMLAGAGGTPAFGAPVGGAPGVGGFAAPSLGGPSLGGPAPMAALAAPNNAAPANLPNL